MLIWALSGYPALAEFSGVLQGHQEKAREALQVSERTGSVNARTYARMGIGFAHILAGEWAAAASILTEALEASRGAVVHEAPHILALLAESHLRLGDADEARAAATRAIELARRSNRLYEPQALIALSRVLMHSDAQEDRAAIERLLDEAAAAVRATGAQSFAPVIHERRARLARQHGDDQLAESELREAHRQYTEIGASGHAERLG